MLGSQQVLPHLAEDRHVFTDTDRAETNHLLLGCEVWTRGPVGPSPPDSLGWGMRYLEEAALCSGSEGKALGWPLAPIQQDNQELTGGLVLEREE